MSDPDASDPDSNENASNPSQDDWTPPACPRCDAPVVMVTTTGPESHYTSCGCRLTLGEARELRARTRE